MRNLTRNYISEVLEIRDTFFAVASDASQIAFGMTSISRHSALLSSGLFGVIPGRLESLLLGVRNACAVLPGAGDKAGGVAHAS
jgi:hypothetical protein